MPEEYPSEFARGILNSDFLDEDLPNANLFYGFKESSRTDGKTELSINWVDSENAVVILKEQKGKDPEKPHYSCGVGLFSTDELKRLCIKNPYCKNALDYERKPIEGNEFHGNLLLIKEANSDIKRRNMIAATIATSCFLRIEKT